MAAVMTGKKRIRWDEPYLCGMNENNGMKDESDYLKGVGMSDGILSKRGKKKMEKMKKFSELVREQYAFLVGQLEKMLQDYFGLSTQVKEMHAEIFSLKTKLVKELLRRCMRESCDKRRPENNVTAV